MTFDRNSLAVLHVSVDTIPFRSFETHMLLGFGIKLTRLARPGNISFVVSIQSASSWEDSLNDDMMARL
jgi:hypothetical protein